MRLSSSGVNDSGGAPAEAEADAAVFDGAGVAYTVAFEVLSFLKNEQVDFVHQSLKHVQYSPNLGIRMVLSCDGLNSGSGTYRLSSSASLLPNLLSFSSSGCCKNLTMKSTLNCSILLASCAICVSRFCCLSSSAVGSPLTIPVARWRLLEIVASSWSSLSSSELGGVIWKFDYYTMVPSVPRSAGSSCGSRAGAASSFDSASAVSVVPYPSTILLAWFLSKRTARSYTLEENSPLSRLLNFFSTTLSDTAPPPPSASFRILPKSLSIYSLSFSKFSLFSS